MAPYVAAPDPHTILLPLLACLPTAFISSRPPPALLPLLAPVLRQRVKLLSETSTNTTESWLPLLCWNTSEASNLAPIVENATFEPHPVSGELELGDVEQIQYRKLDGETLQSLIRLPDFGLQIILLWCENDQEGGSDGWRVAEVMPLSSTLISTSPTWSSSISEAEENRRTASILSDSRIDGAQTLINGTKARPEEEEEDNDDNYWAQYDQTPSGTPAPNEREISPPRGFQRDSFGGKSNTDAEYYARYGSVQPEMDNDDPSTDKSTIGETSLHGNTVVNGSSNGVSHTGSEESGHQEFARHVDGTTTDIIQPRPTSSSSSHVSSTVAQLEGLAEEHSPAAIAIQQHISTSIKSLYRLAKNTGVGREEFERLIHTELEVLSILDEDN